MKLALFYSSINLLISIIILASTSYRPMQSWVGVSDKGFTYFCIISIVIFTTLLNFIISKIIKKKIWITLLFINTISIISSLYICLSINTTPIRISNAERKLENKNNIVQRRTLANKIINEAEIFKPNRNSYEHDSTLIINTLKAFLSKEQDSIHIKTKICGYLGRTYISDSTLDQIANSLNIDLILYSIDHEHIVVFYSFEHLSISKPIEKGGYGSVLIGSNNENSIKLYRYHHDPYSYWLHSTGESLFFSYLSYLSKKGITSSPPINTQEFWKGDKLFGITKIENHNYFNYQTKKRRDSNKWIREPLAPLFEIKK